MRPLCTTVAGRSTAMESPLPGTGRDDGRRGPSEAARRQDRPSPGAARRPLPARERRLFVASLGTAGSFLSTHSTDLHPTGRQCGGDPVGPLSVRRVHWDRVGSCGADVHRGARATHRVAPTCRAYSRVRCTKEHRGRPVAWVVGAVREPPLLRPAGPWCERGDRRPCAGDRFQGTAAPCLYREWLHNGYKAAAGPLVVSGKPLKNQGRV